MLHITWYTISLVKKVFREYHQIDPLRIERKLYFIVLFFYFSSFYSMLRVKKNLISSRTKTLKFLFNSLETTVFDFLKDSFSKCRCFFCVKSQTSIAIFNRFCNISNKDCIKLMFTILCLLFINYNSRNIYLIINPKLNFFCHETYPQSKI